MRTPFLLYGLALVVRLVLVALFPDPAYPDSFYYVDVARALATGQGFNVDFVWIFAEVGGGVPPNAGLPVPSNAHWLPLASILQAPFVALLGPSAFASALPMILIGSLAAPLTWLIARDAGSSPLVRNGAGILSAVPAAGTVFMAQPENFAIFHPLVAATLWMSARGLRGDARAFVLAGLLVGLASVARNDAFLLGGAVGLIFFIERYRAARDHRPALLSIRAAAGCVALYLLVVGPWWVRQLAVFGSISPTASAGSALWLTDYAQWNSITAQVTLDAFLDQGLAAIVSSRFDGFVLAISQFAVVVCSVILVPFVVVGAWRRRRSDAFLPWFLYGAILLLGAGLLFPLHVRGGAFIHSAIGLGPHAFILALEGTVALVGWIAARRPRWNRTAANRLFAGVVVGTTIATAAMYAVGVHAAWRDASAPRVALAQVMDELGVGASDRILSVDAAGMKYFTGRPGIVLPNDPIDTIEQVARAYDIRWLVLERTDGVPAVEPILDGSSRPSWVGPEAFRISGDDSQIARLAIYPVCLSDDDDRCRELAGDPPT